LHEFYKDYLDGFEFNPSCYQKIESLTNKLFEFIKSPQIEIITNNYDNLYFKIEHAINFEELENILAYTIVSDYSQIKLCMENIPNNYFSLISLKYQFLLFKIEGKHIIDRLLEKFQINEKLENNCISNLIVDTLVKYLGVSPKNLTNLVFTRNIVNLIDLIKPKNDQSNGKKIEWPADFLDLVETFMKSARCKTYIASVDSIIKGENSEFHIGKNLSDLDLNNHIHQLVYEFLKKKSFIYHGSYHQIAKNIFNGGIVFNENHNIKQRLKEINQNKCIKAYLLILCVHELLHLKRILFNHNQTYKWPTPNISPFKENLRNDGNEKFPEIGTSFEVIVFGFCVAESMINNEKLCNLILNEKFWNDKELNLKEECLKVLNKVDQKNETCHLTNTDNLDNEKTSCSFHFDIDEYIENVRNLLEKARSMQNL